MFSVMYRASEHERINRIFPPIPESLVYPLRDFIPKDVKISRIEDTRRVDNQRMSRNWGVEP